MRIKGRHIKYYLVIIVLVLSAQSSHAQENRLLTSLFGKSNSIANDSSRTSIDTLFFSSTFNSYLVKPYPVKNIITLQIREDQDNILPASFTAIVHLRIYYTNADNHKDSINDLRLVLNYDSASPYTARTSFVFNGAYRVRMKVLSDTIPGPAMPALAVVNEIVPDRKYVFACTGYDISQVNIDNTTDDELSVSWSNVIGADLYDLEWAYIDSSALASGLYSVNNNLDPGLIFRNNSTRVSVSDLSYKIPLIFSGSGSLFARVRPVHFKNQKKLVSKWSSDYSNGMLQYNFAGHEKKLNWQSSVSFAEDGKRKVVVQYFDGSLRNHQAVTKDNNTNQTIVSETFYDYQGRPAVNVLPAPSINSIIKYANNFNRLNGQEYDKSYFDSVINSTYCGTVARAMDSAYGAAKYYSWNNGFTGNINKNVPEGYGYAFTQTEYTQDNTGRISRQGGVGKEFQLNTGHEIKYYYALTPDQDELDALFGTEAGDHTHYFKNAVRDANGQYSVSYVDMHGRTVATALAGDSPAGISALAYKSAIPVTQTLADASTNTTEGLSMISHKSMLVTKKSDQHFVYALNPQSLQINGCDSSHICYDCLYDLNITVTDGCGGQALVVNKSNVTVADSLCNAAGILLDTTINMEEGNYEITKTLTVSKASRDAYFNNFFLHHNSCKSEQDFITLQQQLLHQDNCIVTCESCRTSIGSYSDFKTNYLTKVYGGTADSVLHQSEIQAAYNSALASCDQYCNDAVNANTDYIRQAMLSDMTPKTGQYANMDFAEDEHSIFYKPNPDSIPVYQRVTGYKDEYGEPDSAWDNVMNKKVPPQQLDATQFAEQFKPSWAEALLPYHPEFCKLTAYQGLSRSYYWEKKFEAVTSYAGALSQGFINPLATGANQDSLAINPIFQSNLSSKYNLYVSSTKSGQTANLSMWRVAILGIKCPAGDTVCAQDNVFNTHDSSLSCAGDSNQAWKNFQQLYLSYRRELLNQYYADVTCAVPTQDLVDDHHFLHFNTAATVLGDSGFAFVSTANQQQLKDSASAKMKAFYKSNCEAYQPLWREQLAPGYSQTQIDTILPMLIDVCVAGSDQDHPFGSRDISFSTASIPETFGIKDTVVRSFDDIINSYNKINSISKSIVRTADILALPGPYNAKQLYTQPIIAKPDAGTCSRINSYYTAYQNYHLSGETFSQYLKRTENTDISDDDLETLQNSCSASDPSCKYLEHPVLVPPVFQSNQNPCTDCNAFGSLLNEYLGKYGDSAYPKVTDQTDTLQQKRNLLFTNFMNNRLGYNLNDADYLEFMDQCSNQSLSTAQALADTLQCNNWAKFTGSQPGIRIGDLDVSGNKLTVEALFNRDTAYRFPPFWSPGDIVSKHEDETDVNYLLRPHSAQLTTTSGFHNVSPTCGIDTNKTYHVAMVYDGQYLKFYRNGFLLGQDTCTGNMILNNWITTIGSTAGPNSEHYNPSDFHGYINEVRIWNVARTQSQIRGYMNTSLPDPTTQTGLLAYYVFDSLKNKQGNSQWDGTLINNTSINRTNPKCTLIPDSCSLDASPPGFPMLCGRSQEAFPPIALDTISSCTDSTFFAVSTGKELYNHYLDSLRQGFDSLYHAKCLNAYNYETFTVTDTLREYHYTLYYYDQAGNLVQTIPPGAVHPNWNTSYLAQVKTKRAAGDTLRPGHDLALATNYRYNTLNKVVGQSSPDAGISTFYHDRLGRLVLSQNKQQSLTNKYSYTSYDAIGRTTEEGELTNAAAMNATVSKTPSQLQSWLSAANSSRTQITQTVYDIPYVGVDTVVFYAKNLRNRVAYTQYFTNPIAQDSLKPGAGTYYSYDIAGNVDTLVQEFKISSFPSEPNRFFKKIVYRYDLISGKVNAVDYNPGNPDAFHHRYTYDAENRITNVETSVDSLYWDNEAFYSYYLHGPLARTELGELEVQGVDYAYTLQGWLKGINTSNIAGSFDMGLDGSQTYRSAKDVYGFTLYYFNDDYKPIAQNRLPFAAMNNTILPAFKPLYNGNIAAASEDLVSFKPLLYIYWYDQLNRLVQMRTYKNTDGSFSPESNVWNPIAVNDYSEDVVYDANGNILKYKRYGNSTNQALTNAKVMDSLLYKYEPNSNRLDRVRDSVGNVVFPGDIDNQGGDNYGYDATGNMIRDNKEGIDSILWTVYGKMDKIYKHNGTVISYSYDAAGNRISKIVTGAASGNGETWYVHDASGNTLSVYTVNNSTVNNGALTLSEQNLFGSSRLGVYKPNLQLDPYTPPDTIPVNGLGGGYFDSFVRGQKFYELSNHLGNVLVTVSDKHIPVVDNGVISYYKADVVSEQDYYPFGMQMPGRTYTASSVSNYRYGFNGKEKDNEVKGDGNQYDYGMRIYDPRISRFLSVDPSFKTYPYYTPYQFAGNMPIAAVDIDGLEAKVSFDYATVTKDRTAIEVRSSVSIKVQVINLSAIPNANLDLQNIALNLSSDLSNKLGGKSTAFINLPFIFKSKDNHVTGVETTKSNEENKDYSVTFNTYVFPDVSVVDDISKINKDTWVFALVDDVNDQKGKDAAGLSDNTGGKVAIGEAKYFERSKAYEEGRQLVLHEILHLLGASDTYPPNSGLPGTQNSNNVMYYLSPENKKQLTPEQIVKEIWISTIGGIGEIFKPGRYKQPENPNSKTPTQQQLKTFIDENGNATKISDTQ
ncbi:MAG TPA: LamG-like jellyroll fold domain-containing protein [Parafilimonas sp.]|nr:LamG-like jellyroll fold domain-containing protein [Parafilimonas sp.]